MIVREILQAPKVILAHFDWFNDYKDTKLFLSGCISRTETGSSADAVRGREAAEILPQLEQGYKDWEIRRRDETNRRLRREYEGGDE